MGIPHTKFMYGCQLCGERFVIEAKHPTLDPKLFVEHANCKGRGDKEEWKHFRGYGVIVAVEVL